jgi:hypothetical protein
MYVSAQSNKPNSKVNLLIYEDGKLLENIVRAGDYPIIQASGVV